MKVMLTYSFIFEPDELWNNRYMFEGSLATMFAKVGIEAEQVQTPARKNGEPEVKVLILKRKEEPAVSKPVKMPSLKQVREDLVKKGRYEDKKFATK